MLGFITTDAAVGSSFLKKALRIAVEQSFNRITVDGDMSTNDSVIALANGLAGNRRLDGVSPHRHLFQAALNHVCLQLAKMIVHDGEGVTRVVTLRVKGARSPKDAEAVARAIANSTLVRTSWFGGDPNWGRLVAVAGRATRTLVLDRASIRIGPVELFSDGAPFDERAPEAAEYLRGKEIDLHVDLGTGGPGEARMWSCDLTADYVRINADYRT